MSISKTAFTPARTDSNHHAENLEHVATSNW